MTLRLPCEEVSFVDVSEVVDSKVSSWNGRGSRWRGEVVGGMLGWTGGLDGSEGAMGRGGSAGRRICCKGRGGVLATSPIWEFGERVRISVDYTPCGVNSCTEYE